MNKNQQTLLAVFLLFIGIFLRLTDITIPDFATDEAQATLGRSAAWTPLGMQMFVLFQSILGPEMIVARFVSFVFGVLSLGVIYLLSAHLTEKRTALLITCIAALFPSHILFSKLAYPTMQLSFWWLLTLLAFLKARDRSETKWLVLLFTASVCATLTKTQGLLLPGVFLLGRLAEKKKDAASDEVFWTLFLGLVPVALYILTHPGIAATLFLYGGNMYGVSGFMMRIVDIVVTWWKVLSLFLIAIIVSLQSVKNLPWPVWALMSIGVLIGLLLGPGHEYYSTHLVLFAIPMGMTLQHVPKVLKGVSITLLVFTSVALFGPIGLTHSPWTYPLYQEHGFWNTYAEEVNEAIGNEEEITVLGKAGHHIRWYLEPRVLVGKDMKQPYPTDTILLLGLDAAAKASGTVEFVIEDVAVIRQKRE